MRSLEVASLEAILETTPESITREAAQDKAADDERADRRSHPRIRGDELDWLRRVRLKSGPEVVLLDLSRGGALIEARVQLKPGAVLTLELAAGGSIIDVPAEVLRCGIATLHGAAAVYRGAFSFPDHLALDRIQRQYPTSGPPEPPAGTAAAWQKIVVRYREGGTLKGYTLDFHPSRGHLSLWPSIHAAASERVIVPLARLKALFFVKDFAGNAAHVSPDDYEAATGGRRIEVTFFDREIVRGTTLNYRPDGAGFFITPADNAGNNRRVFVINAAVRHVRFP